MVKCIAQASILLKLDLMGTAGKKKKKKRSH